MPLYSISFFAPSSTLFHQMVSAENREAALKIFFEKGNGMGYSTDKEGYNYFMDDFSEGDSPVGSIIEVENR